jgi:hypothetical protein
MPQDFLVDASANLLGTFVGAGLALLTAALVKRAEQRRSELTRLQRLIDRIYRSRALTQKPMTTQRVAQLSTEERGHFQRVTSSIFTIRNLIEEAAGTFHPKATAVPVLDDMYAATLEYLNAIEVDDRDYLNESMRLREALIAGEARLKRLHGSLVLRDPGGIASAPA